MTLDGELLRRYAESDSEEAFAELVRRRLDLVYSSALRQVNGDAALAQEVTQSVFTDLARKAAILSRRPVLTGWLYTSTHFASAKAVRTERRRHAHEQEAHAMNELLQASAPDFEWEKLRPVLDQMMHQLKEADRDVILMRYFENRPLADIGEALGVSEDTARKRVDRALEKLRVLASKQGIGTAAALGAVLSSNAIQMAPAGLAATLASASVAGTAAGTGTTLTLVKATTMTKIQAGFIGAVVLAGVLTPLIFQQRALADLREQNVALTRQVAQLDPLPAENQALSNSPPSPSLSPGQLLELLRLRSVSGMQKDELKKLRAELAARKSLAAAKASALANYFPKEAWASAGYATPEAAVQSVSWKLGQMKNHNDLKNALPFFPSDMQAEITKYYAGKSDSEIDADVAHVFAEGFAKTDGIRIVNEQTVTDDEVIVTFMNFMNNGTNDGWGRFLLKRSGNEWGPAASSDQQP